MCVFVCVYSSAWCVSEMYMVCVCDMCDVRWMFTVCACVCSVYTQVCGEGGWLVEGNESLLWSPLFLSVNLQKGVSGWV